MSMNISNDGPLPVSTDGNGSEVNNSKVQQKDEASPFSRMLAKKQTAGEGDGNLKGNARTKGDFNALLDVMMSSPSPFDQPSQVSKVESKHTVDLPPELQNLVREIAVVNGGREVHIEMNSNALKGLHIRIEKQDGAVAIQFQSTSEDTARLLSRNIDGLSQSLADRGVNVADIRVTTAQETSSKWSQKQNPKRDQQSGGQSQSGRQGQR